MPTLVLASGSPRRREFLAELGYSFQVVASHIDEQLLAGEHAVPYGQRLARTKATTVAERVPGAVVLAADTVVVVDDHVLGKPEDEADLCRMLTLMSGRSHLVVTAVAVRDAAGQLFEQAVETEVTFRRLSDEEMSWYWSTGEPHDKAGGYALQGKGGAFITGIRGSHSNVIGLPLVETVRLLQQAGLEPPWTRRE